MRSNTMKKMLFTLLCGGMLFQLAGCGATIASLLVDLILQYGLTAVLTGLAV